MPGETPPLPLDQVLSGDCLEVLDGLPAESVDLVFADPPYNLQLRQELLRPNQSRVDAVDDAWDHFSDFSAYDAFTRGWLSACRRVLKPNGTLWVIGTYHNIYRVGTALQDLDFWVLNEVTWIKANPMPNFRGVRLTNAHETLIWAQKGRGAHYTFNYHAMKEANDGLQMRSDWYLPLCTGKERLKVNGEKAHSTQKPVVLLLRVLACSTNPGDTVLDPFFGTGTTGVAAKRMRRHWIGIEQDAGYVALARQRIAEDEEIVADEKAFETYEPRRQRIPFRALVECGLLQPGQRLCFQGDPAKSARVLSDGAIEYNGRRGSIHQAARQHSQKSSNGWQEWYFQDAEDGQWRPLDELRRRYLNLDAPDH